VRSTHACTLSRYAGSGLCVACTDGYIFPQANCNRLLDVARETYKENVGDIHQLHRALSDKHNLPLILVYQEGGFVFALKKDDLDGDLPKSFINLTAQKGRWVFTSMELVSAEICPLLHPVRFRPSVEKDERQNERRFGRDFDAQ
jgi:hypothetical protein